MAEQYVVFVQSNAGACQAFGPFYNYEKAEKICDKIGDADGGNGEVLVWLTSLDRPAKTEVDGWVESAGAWRNFELDNDDE